jgi:NitT/TauT family transport system ATP-binding protein
MSSGIGLLVQGVSHAYRGLKVLDAIDFEIAPGEVTVLVGPSGCGKSTLLGILGGLVKPVEGAVRLYGEAPADCLNPLTYIFQDFALVPWRSVAGNVSLVLEDSALSRAERAARVAEVLATTGLTDFAHAWPRQLSGGMRQRVGIARALAVRPAVLLMDEPLSALDAQTRDLLLDEFALLIARSGVTTVYVTHNLAEATRLGRRIVVLGRRPGRVRQVIEIDTPLTERRADDLALRAIEAELWGLLRQDAAQAAQELADDAV